MPNYSDQLVRIAVPVLAALSPSQDTTPDQLTSFYRPAALPLVRHSPLPVAANAPVNAAANASARTTVETVIQSGGSIAGVTSLNNLTGALALISPGTTLAIGTAGADVTADVVSATSAQLGGLVLGTDLGNSAAAPHVVATHLASPLPINQGGTATTTPALVAGTGISISGSWPNQTINATGTVTASVVAVAAAYYTALASIKTINASVLTIIDQIAVTMPSTGGPWRAHVSYNYYKNGGVNYHSYIYDGTHGWGGCDYVTQSNLTSLQDSAFSPVTYTNTANITFTTYIYDTGNSTIEKASQIYTSSAAVSNMQVCILASN